MSRVGFDIGVQHAGLSAVIYFCAQFGSGSSSSASRDDGGLWGRLLAHLNQDGDQDTALPPPLPSPPFSLLFFFVFFFFSFFSSSSNESTPTRHGYILLYPVAHSVLTNKRWTQIRPLILLLNKLS